MERITFILGFILGSFIAILFSICNFTNSKKTTEKECIIKESKKGDLDCRRIEILKFEYEHLLNDVHQRGSEFITFISIFISVSILILLSILESNKDTTIVGFKVKLLIIIPMILILAISWFNTCSVRKLDNLFWTRIKEIEGLLGIEYGHHGIWKDIQDNLWYKVRKQIWNMIFLLIIFISFIVLIFG